jgi:hypothetical protein
MNTKSFCLAALLFLLLVQSAWGWGRFGHEVTGHLAWFELEPAAREAIEELLEGESLALATVWADEVRPDRPVTAPFHYINGPVNRLEPTDAHWNLERGNVYSAILGYAEILANPERPRQERREALKFLVHFIGDLHQPLHAGFGEDRGGNDIPVVYNGELTNLHRYWDSTILVPHSSRYSSAEYAAILFHAHGRDERRRWTSIKDPKDWVREARTWIFAGLYPPPRVDQEAVIEGPVGVVDEAYREVWLPVAETQLARAGSRMARTLNLIFLTGRSPFDPPPIDFPPAG